MWIPIAIAIGTLVWGITTRTNLLDQVEIKNKKIQSIVNASRKTAIATDHYIRSMADGTLTIEEGAEFKNLAAEAIISQLLLVEEVTGHQIYNRTEVPLPLPVGGSRIPTERVTSTAPDTGTVIVTVPALEQTTENIHPLKQGIEEASTSPEA